MRYFYNLLFYLLLPFIFLRLLWRSRQSPAYRQRWQERLGFCQEIKSPNPVWIHAVSFGEAKVATGLIEVLHQQDPNLQFVVTTMTVTGSQQISKAFGNSVFHFYVPYDYPGAVLRFLKRTHPKLLIVMETELWPNILYYCRKKHIPIIVANARLSERSAKNYRRITFFLKPILKNITQVLAQSTADAQRFQQLGVPPELVHVAGNIKFDITPPENLLQQGYRLREQLGKHRHVWIAASTHRGEDEIILQAFTQIQSDIPDALLILVPRHPERFDEVAKLCKQNFQFVRRSDTKNQQQNFSNIDIYLGDTMGELWLLYAAADVVFVGGSLIKQGGHNLLEPAALGLPIITGPYLFNFLQIKQLLQSANALTIINNAEELANKVIHFFQDNAARIEQGKHAQKVVLQNQGALQNHLRALSEFITDRHY